MLEPFLFCAQGGTPRPPSLIRAARLSLPVVRPVHAKRCGCGARLVLRDAAANPQTGSLHAVIDIFIVLCEGSYPGNSGKRGCILDPAWVEANPILAGAGPAPLCFKLQLRKPYRIQ